MNWQPWYLRYPCKCHAWIVDETGKRISSMIDVESAERIITAYNEAVDAVKCQRLKDWKDEANVP